MAQAPTIKYSFWLRFSYDGRHPTASKNQPPLGVDERAMHCVVELPRSLFVRPQLVANIRVNELPAEPMSINIEAAETALSEVLGVDVLFTVVPAKPEEPAS